MKRTDKRMKKMRRKNRIHNEAKVNNHLLERLSFVKPRELNAVPRAGVYLYPCILETVGRQIEFIFLAIDRMINGGRDCNRKPKKIKKTRIAMTSTSNLFLIQMNQSINKLLILEIHIRSIIHLFLRSICCNKCF